MLSATLTIINDNNLRGVIAPAAELSEETLTDLIDFIEMTSPASIADSERLIAEAERDNSKIRLVELCRKGEALPESLFFTLKSTPAPKRNCSRYPKSFA